jgi:hypothetical protein
MPASFKQAAAEAGPAGLHVERNGVGAVGQEEGRLPSACAYPISYITFGFTDGYGFQIVGLRT